MCWHVTWSAVGWRIYLPVLLFIGTIVGGLSIRELLVPLNPTDIASLHVYSYSLWSPYLLIWLGGCIAASGLAVLRRGWPRTPRQGAVLLALIALALTIVGLVYPSDNDLAAELYSLYSLDTNSLFTLIAFMLLLIAAAGAYYSDWLADPPRWPIRAELSPSKAILIGLVLALSLIDLIYFSSAKPYLGLMGFLLAWILIAELILGGPLGYCYDQVVKPSLRRAIDVLNTKNNYKDEREGSVQKNLTTWLGKLLSFGSPGMALVKMLIFLVLLIAMTDVPNAGKILIDPFKTEGDVKSTNLGHVFSDDLLSHIADIKRELEPDAVRYGPSTGAKFVPSGAPTGGIPAAIAGNDELQIGAVKIPLDALLAPIRVPVRMLLHVRVIDGEIHGDDHGYTVTANSSTGEVWRADWTPETDWTPEHPEGGPPSAVEPSGPMDRLARKLAFKFAIADPALAPLMTRSWDAFDAFEDGSKAWDQFETQRFQATKSLDRALSSFWAGTLADPQFALGYYRLGLALQEEGQPDAAVAAFQTSLKENPDLVESKMALAVTLLNFDFYYYDRFYQTPIIGAQQPAVEYSTWNTKNKNTQLTNARVYEASDLWKQVIRPQLRGVSHQDRASAYYWLCLNEARSVARETRRMEKNPALTDEDRLKKRPHYYVPYFYCKRSEVLRERLRSVRHPDPQSSKEEGQVLDLLGLILEKEGDPGALKDGDPGASSGRVGSEWSCNPNQIDDSVARTSIDQAVMWRPRQKNRYTGAALRYFVEGLNLTPYDPQIACDAAEADFALDHPERMSTLARQASAHLNAADTAKEIARQSAGRLAPELVDFYYWLALDEYDKAVNLNSAEIEARIGYAQTYWEWMNWYRSVTQHAEWLTSKWLEEQAPKAEEYARYAVVLVINKQDPVEEAKAQSAYGKALLAQPQSEKAGKAAGELRIAVAHLKDLPDHPHPYFHEMRWDLAEAYLCASMTDDATKLLRKIEEADQLREHPFPVNLLDPKRRLSVCQSSSGNTRSHTR
jgi:hypothetical protein